MNNNTGGPPPIRRYSPRPPPSDPKPARTPGAAGRGRLTLALLLSLLIHALLLSLTFGGQRFGLPGFVFPWRERRIEAPDLRVVLVPAKVAAAEPLPRASIEQTVAAGPAPARSVLTAALPVRTAEAIVPQEKVEPKATTTTGRSPDIATAAVPAQEPLPTEGPGDAAPTPIPVPEVITVERSAEPTFVVPPPAPPPTPVIAVAPSVPGPETVTPPPQAAGEVAQKRAEPEARGQTAEVAKPDPPAREKQGQRQVDQLEAARIEAAQREAARQEAARVEAARLEAARLEAARLEAARLETQVQEATQLAAAQREAQRLEVARQEAARVEAARLEAARRETERQEAVRQAAAQKEAARILAEKEEDARRAARREAMGRQLNEEAARREEAATAARSPSTLPYSLSTARRVRLWGRSDPNAELVQYAEAWARKIQSNTSVDTVRDVAKRPHTNPMVTVAIRSDGSVETVTFVVSSGVAEVDDAIRRIVQSHASYPAFPPGLAAEVDVIEVRRTWHFDVGIRLY